MKNISVLLGLGVALACPTFAQDEGQKVYELFKARCYQCHGESGRIKGGFGAILDFQRLKTAYIDLEKPENSKIYAAIAEDDMPRGGVAKLTAAEKSLVLSWIRNGARSPEATPRAPISGYTWQETLALARKDLETLSNFDARSTRYVSLHTIAKDKQEVAAAGVRKLINSLTWAPLLPLKVSSVDPLGLLLRINLSELGWSAGVWERLASFNALGPIPVFDNDQDGNVQFLRNLTGSRAPIITADLFASLASRPPFYHELLDLPQTVSDLEEGRLGFSLRSNLTSGNVQRSGFSQSGVSLFNRMIERHETRYGAYWKSYDFDSNSERADLFRFPLGPEASVPFEHAGGEVIFNLPNGLQAYLLVNDRGERLDRAPVEIVHDSSQRDPVITNGLSCMSCHTEGVKYKGDEIRSHMEANSDSFGPEIMSFARRVYVQKIEFKKRVEEDQERFQTALRLLSAEKYDGGIEPVRALVNHFEADLHLAQAALELGVSEARLLQLGAAPAAAPAPVQGVVERLRKRGLSRQVFSEFAPTLRRLLGIKAELPVETVSAAAPVPGEVFNVGDRVISLSERMENGVKGNPFATPYRIIRLSTDKKQAVIASINTPLKSYSAPTADLVLLVNSVNGFSIGTVVLFTDGLGVRRSGSIKAMTRNGQVWVVISGPRAGNFFGHTQDLVRK